MKKRKIEREAAEEPAEVAEEDAGGLETSEQRKKKQLD